MYQLWSMYSEYNYFSPVTLCVLLWCISSIFIFCMHDTNGWQTMISEDIATRLYFSLLYIQTEYICLFKHHTSHTHHSFQFLSRCKKSHNHTQHDDDASLDTTGRSSFGSCHSLSIHKVPFLFRSLQTCASDERRRRSWANYFGGCQLYRLDSWIQQSARGDWFQWVQHETIRVDTGRTWVFVGASSWENFWHDRDTLTHSLTFHSHATGATWCGPCKIIGPIFDELSNEISDVVFVKVDVDENPETAAKYSVSAMPTFVFIKGGEVVDRLMGANPDRLREMIQDYM
jgi:thioredoxin 1